MNRNLKCQNPRIEKKFYIFAKSKYSKWITCVIFRTVRFIMSHTTVDKNDTIIIYQLSTNYYVQNACYCKFGLTNYEYPSLLYPCDHKSFIRLKIQLKCLWNIRIFIFKIILFACIYNIYFSLIYYSMYVCIHLAMYM